MRREALNLSFHFITKKGPPLIPLAQYNINHKDKKRLQRDPAVPCF